MSHTDFSKPTPILAEAVRSVKPGCALDVGCGNGRNTLFLARNGWEVHALDPSSDTLQNIDEISARERLGIKTYLGEIQTFHSTKKFDLVICLMVLHFFNEEDILNTIKWMRDHTTAGGMNIISAFTDKNAPGTRPHLFASRELISHYKEWGVDTYQESDSSILSPDNKVLTYKVARLITTKVQY